MIKQYSVIQKILLMLLIIPLFWLSLHILALMGIIIGIVYLLIWFKFPTKVPCLICYSHIFIQKMGIRTKQHLEEIRHWPANNKSVAQNIAILIILQVLGIILVNLEVKVWLVTHKPKDIEEYAVFNNETQRDFLTGELFEYPIKVKNLKTPINAIQADIAYNQDILEVVQIHTHNSFANIFLEKNFNNEAGLARIAGGLPNPGFIGVDGLFAEIIFRTKTAGIALVEYLPTSLVLANDGNATNVLQQFTKEQFIVLPKKISPSEQQEQEAEILDSVNLQSDISNVFNLYETGAVLGVSTDLKNARDKTKTKSSTPWWLWLKAYDVWVLEILHLY